MSDWRLDRIRELQAEINDLRRRIGAVAAVKTWRNEDGVRFLYADDVWRALEPELYARLDAVRAPIDSPESVPPQVAPGSPSPAGRAAADGEVPGGSQVPEPLGTEHP